MSDIFGDGPESAKGSGLAAIRDKIGLSGLVDIRFVIKALSHFAIFAVILAVVNLLFARSDPGWVGLNPSPWVILPFYLGFRFGFIFGAGSGLALIGIRLLIAGIIGKEGEVLTGAENFLMWSVVLSGVIGGLVRGFIRREEEQKDRLLHDSLTSNKVLKSQVALLKHNEQDLASTIVAQGLETTGLTLGLQDIISQYTDADRDEAMLNLLKDRCGVRSAAIYYSARDGRAVRTAHLVEDETLPESMEKTPMIDQAERSVKIVTQRWFWEPFEPNASGGLDDQFLAVIAHPKDRDYRVLVISRMDFEQIHWENFWKIESAYRWFEDAVNNGISIVAPSSVDDDRTVEEKRADIVSQEIADAESQTDKTQSDAPVEIPMVQDEPDAGVIDDEVPAAVTEPELEPEPEAYPEPVAAPEVDLEPEPIPQAVTEPEPEPAAIHEEPDVEPEPIPEPEGKPILDAVGFKKRLIQIREIQEQTGQEHRVVIFAPGADESPSRCEAFAHSLSMRMPQTDDLAEIPSEGGRFVYGLITPATTSDSAEQHATALLNDLPDLDLRFFVLRLSDQALSAFQN